MKIGMIVGSLRKDSFNRKIAMVLKEQASTGCETNLIEIGDLPFFNQDLEENPPSQWVGFRNQIKEIDGFILVTPEYNRSYPAVIKNAIDVGSRPYGKNLWDGKPCAIVSVSIGAIGGFGANHHLRQSMVFLNAPCLQQPEVYLSSANKLFDEKGQLNNTDTRNFLGQFMQTFEKWVVLHKK